MDPYELRTVLAKHRLWLKNRAMGEPADLRGVSLQGECLRGVNLAGAELEGINLKRATARKAKFAGANLRRANLAFCCLERADMRGADCQEADLWTANMRGANLENCSFKGANLRRADLWGANVRHANFDGADLLGANIEGANMQATSLCRAYGISPVSRFPSSKITVSYFNKHRQRLSPRNQPNALKEAEWVLYVEEGYEKRSNASLIHLVVPGFLVAWETGAWPPIKLIMAKGRVVWFEMPPPVTTQNAWMDEAARIVMKYLEEEIQR